MLDKKTLNEMAKMRSLIERMEKPHTARQAMLNEDMWLNEGVERQVKGPDEVFELLDQIGKNDFVCVGLVTGSNLDVPQVKRKNPATNRMKSYDDYETFGRDTGVEGEIGALVRITSYNFRFYNVKDMGTNYGKFKDSFNQIRQGYGLPPVQDKENDYTETMNYGSGVVVYNGDDESKKGNFYIPANTHGARKNSVVYAIDKEGHIMATLTDEQVKPYLKKKGQEVDGANALRKMGAEEEQVKKYIEDVRNLKFSYKRFLGNTLLWVAATVNNEKVVYINDRLSKTVNDINIDPQDFVNIAKERYAVDMKNLPEEGV